MVQKNRRGVLHHTSRKIGTTVLGAPLEVYEPSEHSTSYMVMAGQHGTEPETTLLLSYVMRSITTDNLCCPVVLAANPDGLQRGTRGNANGVDLNRNFPTSNWEPALVRHRWEEDEEQEVELSPGNDKASEPETKAILDFVAGSKIKTIITIHAPLNCIDDPDKTKLAQQLSTEMNLPLIEHIGYPTPGSLGSWGKENDVSVITVELPYESMRDHRKRFSQALEKLLKGKTNS